MQRSIPRFVLESIDGGDGRSLAVRPIRTANLGAARPEGEGANPNYDDNK